MTAREFDCQDRASLKASSGQLDAAASAQAMIQDARLPMPLPSPNNQLVELRTVEAIEEHGCVGVVVGYGVQVDREEASYWQGKTFHEYEVERGQHGHCHTLSGFVLFYTCDVGDPVLIHESTLRSFNVLGGKWKDSDELYVHLAAPDADTCNAIDSALRTLHVDGIFSTAFGSYLLVSGGLESRGRNHGFTVTAELQLGVQVSSGRCDLSRMCQALRNYRPTLQTLAMATMHSSGTFPADAPAAMRLWAESLLPGLPQLTEPRNEAFLELLERANEVADDATLVLLAEKFSCDYEENMSVEQLKIDTAEFATIDAILKDNWRTEDTPLEVEMQNHHLGPSSNSRVARAFWQVYLDEIDHREIDHELRCAASAFVDGAFAAAVYHATGSGPDPANAPSTENWRVDMKNGKPGFVPWGDKQANDWKSYKEFLLDSPYQMRVLTTGEWDEARLFVCDRLDSYNFLAPGEPYFPFDGCDDNCVDMYENTSYMTRLLKNMGFTCIGQPGMKLLMAIRVF